MVRRQSDNNNFNTYTLKEINIMKNQTRKATAGEASTPGGEQRA